MDPHVRIGCAGWSIPSGHSHLFGDGNSHLARYATRFDVVEITTDGGETDTVRHLRSAFDASPR